MPPLPFAFTGELIKCLSQRVAVASSLTPKRQCQKGNGDRLQSWHANLGAGILHGVYRKGWAWCVPQRIIDLLEG